MSTENDLTPYFEPAAAVTGLDAFMPAGQTFGGSLASGDCDVALIGLAAPAGSVSVADAVRPFLFQLRGQLRNLRVADLGNIKTGNGGRDQFFALQGVVQELGSRGVVSVVIGNSQQETLAMFQGLRRIKDEVNFTVIDARFDVENGGYLRQILEDGKLGLRNVLGHQSYYTSRQQEAQLLKSDAIAPQYRLGRLRQSLIEAEPVLRDTDLLSVDMCSVRQSDAPGCAVPSPNGFAGEELCQLMRMAGCSDRVMSAGFFGMEPGKDPSGQTAALLAQVVWHFCEALSNRVGDFPAGSITLCDKIIVPAAQSDYVFYHGHKRDRWWVGRGAMAKSRYFLVRPRTMAGQKREKSRRCGSDIL